MHTAWQYVAFIANSLLLVAAIGFSYFQLIRLIKRGK